MVSINHMTELTVIDVGHLEYEGVAYPSWSQPMV
jgi:hypothetical protein